MVARSALGGNQKLQEDVGAAVGRQWLSVEADIAAGFWKLQTDTVLGTGPLTSETEGGGWGSD